MGEDWIWGLSEGPHQAGHAVATVEEDCCALQFIEGTNDPEINQHLEDTIMDYYLVEVCLGSQSVVTKVKIWTLFMLDCFGSSINIPNPGLTLFKVHVCSGISK